MSDLILLRDKHRCPQCRARRSFSGGNCSNCGMRLFINPINFKQFEDDGNIRRYWLWTNDLGWKHRDYVMSPDAAPQARSWEFTSPERNTPASVNERLAQIKRDTAMKVKRDRYKGNVFGYGKSITKIK